MPCEQKPKRKGMPELVSSIAFRAGDSFRVSLEFVPGTACALTGGDRGE